MVQQATSVTRRFGIPEWVVALALSLMAAAFVEYVLRAQGLPVTQDGINATLMERQVDLARRLDHIESMVQSVVVGVFLQLIALLIYMAKTLRKV